MQAWLESCEDWLTTQYKDILGLDLGSEAVRLRWLSEDSLTIESNRADAQSLVVEDAEIGWLLFLLPYVPEFLEHQINQALGLRSQLLRESNYTGTENPGARDDPTGSWRVGLVWLVGESNWTDWQHQIIELRRESGAAEEITFDAVRIDNHDVKGSLDKHGLSRLLLHTRALLRQTPEEAENWLSADRHVLEEIKDFSQRFSTARARTIARELEEQAKILEPAEKKGVFSQPRRLQNFHVQNFRNLKSLEIAVDHPDDHNAEAIILYGPNGTGKSSLAEAISLAAFETSPLLERFMVDKDIAGRSGELYQREYLTPLGNDSLSPGYSWNKGEKTEFILHHNEESKSLFEGVILNQEDSIKFTDLSRGELAQRVLSGYSALAEKLSGWLEGEARRAKDAKSVFTKQHGLNSAITRSSTAYNRLADRLLTGQLQRPSPEYIDWLRFLGHLSGEDGQASARLVSDWQNYHATTVKRLAETLVKLQEEQASRSHLKQAINEGLDDYDVLAKRSDELRQHMEKRLSSLHDQLENALLQIDAWGTWLASQGQTPDKQKIDSSGLQAEIEGLVKERTELEKNGKLLRGRLDLLDQASQYLTIHWLEDHPDICPVCDSNVEDRQGIESVVSVLQEETSTAIQALRNQYAKIQAQQKELDTRLKAEGASVCPVAIEEQAQLREWLVPFMPADTMVEDWLKDPQRRQQLKNDISRMMLLPEPPKPYADTAQESDRLATEFMSLAQEADKVLEDPQAFTEVRKAFEQLMEKILVNHLPATLGKVWQELTMTLTTATWLLPDEPDLLLEKRGKSLSVQLGKTGRYIRYIFNSAERHVLGLAWFFTYYLARRRFDEAWMLLDDPAQQMDQASYRELARFWETLLRLYQKNEQPLTMIIALHQEERALDAARSTNGKLYILGWRGKQEDTGNRPSVKKIVLLAPGYHPLKPEKMFSDGEKAET